MPSPLAAGTIDRMQPVDKDTPELYHGFEPLSHHRCLRRAPVLTILTGTADPLTASVRRRGIDEWAPGRQPYGWVV